MENNNNEIQENFSMKIDSQAIELSKLAKMLEAIDNAYKETATYNGYKETEISVEKVKEGSFIFDFALKCTSLIKETNSAIDFIEKIKKLRTIFAKNDLKNIDKNNLPTKSEAENICNIVQPIINYGTINFYTKDNKNSVSINKDEANQISKNANYYANNIEKFEHQEYENKKLLKDVWITFIQAKIVGKTGSKVICNSVSDKALNGRFNNEEMQSKITHSKNNPFLFKYQVDLEIEYKDINEPKSYLILDIKNKMPLEPNDLDFGNG